MQGVDEALQPLGKPVVAPRLFRAPVPHLVMPDHHEVRAKDVVTRRLRGALAAAAEQGPQDFPELLLVPGIGARAVGSLGAARRSGCEGSDNQDEKLRGLRRIALASHH
jgi:hypothetical protein